MFDPCAKPRGLVFVTFILRTYCVHRSSLQSITDKVRLRFFLFFLLPDSPPLLINIKQIENIDSWLDSPNNVYIGRYCRGLNVQSPWYNPYKITPSCSRYEVIELYKTFLSQNRDLLALLPRLGNKTLACWCHPLPCHGDAIIQAFVSLPFIEEEEED